MNDRLLEELKNAVMSGELDGIIAKIVTTTGHIDETVLKAETYLSRMFIIIRKDTDGIRGMTNRLISDHIEKIRHRILQQPLPPF